MSTLAIVLIAVAALALALLLTGFLGERRRDARRGDHAEHVAQADRALEQARAADRGWDRGLLEAAAREALERQRPGVSWDQLDLVLVDDRPGVEEDGAHFHASGPAGDARVVLSRRAGEWALDRVE